MKKKEKDKKPRRRGMAAWEIGWDGARPVEARELAALAGISEHMLWVDRNGGLLGEPEPRPAGVRIVIYAAATARSYLKKKRPSALVFRAPPVLISLSPTAA